jgi:branched-chain amino acid transport system substrate-binding protein
MRNTDLAVDTKSGRRKARAVAGILLAGVLVLAACGGSDDDPGAGSSATTDQSSGGGGGLGEEQPATGEPVKIGFVLDGRTPSFDNSSAADVSEAMVQYFNAYRGGIGGRPIELVTCESMADPGKSADCANELIQEDVVLTVMTSLATLTEVWRPLNEAGVPTFIFSTTDREVLEDTKSTFAVGSPNSVLIELPISVAKKAKAKKVVGVIVDVPAATAIYEDRGEELFADANLDFELVKIPLGQPDLTPQMADIADQDDVAVHIVGTDTMAIAALNGLEASGFEGAISCIGCDADSVRKAIGSRLEGIAVSASGESVGGDTADLDLYHAILDEYAPSVENRDDTVPLYTYGVWAAMREGLEDLEGDITSDTIVDTFRSMPSRRLPTFGGAQFRCNGKADPVYPAACSSSGPVGVMDASGKVVDIRVTSTDPIPD